MKVFFLPLINACVNQTLTIVEYQWNQLCTACTNINISSMEIVEFSMSSFCMIGVQNPIEKLLPALHRYIYSSSEKNTKWYLGTHCSALTSLLCILIDKNALARWKTYKDVPI